MVCIFSSQLEIQPTTIFYSNVELFLLGVNKDGWIQICSLFGAFFTFLFLIREFVQKLNAEGSIFYTPQPLSCIHLSKNIVWFSRNRFLKCWWFGLLYFLYCIFNCNLRYFLSFDYQNIKCHTLRKTILHCDLIHKRNFLKGNKVFSLWIRPHNWKIVPRNQSTFFWDNYFCNRVTLWVNFFTPKYLLWLFGYLLNEGLLLIKDCRTKRWNRVCQKKNNDY